MLTRAFLNEAAVLDVISGNTVIPEILKVSNKGEDWSDLREVGNYYMTSVFLFSFSIAQLFIRNGNIQLVTSKLNIYFQIANKLSGKTIFSYIFGTFCNTESIGLFLICVLFRHVDDGKGS